ncbi:MAG TPA: hypothetical protein QF813_00495, partial [Alphaproteobacteria bacterium]|nr:hypothetical protein [Alphaproteobacteria bacterium]
MIRKEKAEERSGTTPFGLFRSGRAHKDSVARPFGRRCRTDRVRHAACPMSHIALRSQESPGLPCRRDSD